jgi:protein-S-isoprenylcysteine O-methyltransferase Ste14
LKEDVGMSPPILPGYDIWLSKLPDLRRPGPAALALLRFALTTTAGVAFLVWFDRLFPGAPLAGQAIVAALAFGILALFFGQRCRLRERYGSRAYQAAIYRYGLTGMPLIPVMVTHPGFTGGERVLPLVIGLPIALYLLTVGLLLIYRAIMTFGIDTVAVVYVYFPEEGRLVDNRIYSVLRHSLCAGVLRVGIGLGVWRGTPMSLVVAASLPVGLSLWLWLVEERELLERFGEGYREYRRRVPAFVARPRDLPTLWRFLLRGG